MRVKICGITGYEDAVLALDQGADVLGFVLARSPRRLPPAAVLEIRKRLPPFALTVGVLVAPEATFARSLLEEGVVDRLQVHRGGFEHPLAYPSFPSGALRAGAPLPPLLHLDATEAPLGGGSGRLADWTLAEARARRPRLILAGGLPPENVAEAVRRVRPFGVDVSSGVESEPGRKDPQKMKEFCDAAFRA